MLAATSPLSSQLSSPTAACRRKRINITNPNNSRVSAVYTAAHVEFDRYGKYALLSIWDPDGAVVVYDANTLEELKRLPMRKPSGNYNVYTKITRSEGTSH